MRAMLYNTPPPNPKLHISPRSGRDAAGLDDALRAVGYA